MKLLKSAVLLALIPGLAQGQSCSFTTNFGNGAALSTSGNEGFNAAGGGTTRCTLTCDGGAATTLYVKYGGTPSIFDNDGSSFDANGCSTSVSISSGSNEFTLGYQISSATYNNLQLSCSCSSVGPSEPSTAICFPGSANAMTRDHGPVSMKDLTVGDMVLVGYKGKQNEPVFEPVYSFGHIQEAEKATFLRLYTNVKAPTRLEISESHMIYKLEGGKAIAVRADAVKVSDVLLQGNATAEVTRIERHSKRGLYMPLTPSGSIAVDGVKASTYVSIQEWAPSVVEVLTLLGFSEHFVFHGWLAPYRFACLGLSKQFCGERDEEGVLQYLLKGKQIAQLAEGYGSLGQVLLFGPPFAIFAFFLCLEYPLGPSGAPMFVAAVLGALLCVKLVQKRAKWTKETV